MNKQIIPKHKELKKGNIVYLDYTKDESHKEFCGKHLTVVRVESEGNIFCEANEKSVLLRADKTDGFFSVRA